MPQKNLRKILADFSGGIADRFSPRDIADNFFQTMTNINNRISGKLSRRPDKTLVKTASPETDFMRAHISGNDLVRYKTQYSTLDDSLDKQFQHFDILSFSITPDGNTRVVLNVDADDVTKLKTAKKLFLKEGSVIKFNDTTGVSSTDLFKIYNVREDYLPNGTTSPPVDLTGVSTTKTYSADTISHVAKTITYSGVGNILGTYNKILDSSNGFPVLINGASITISNTTSNNATRTVIANASNSGAISVNETVVDEVANSTTITYDLRDAESTRRFIGFEIDSKFQFEDAYTSLGIKSLKVVLINEATSWSLLSAVAGTNAKLPTGDSIEEGRPVLAKTNADTASSIDPIVTNYKNVSGSYIYGNDWAGGRDYPVLFVMNDYLKLSNITPHSYISKGLYQGDTIDIVDIDPYFPVNGTNLIPAAEDSILTGSSHWIEYSPDSTNLQAFTKGTEHVTIDPTAGTTDKQGAELPSGNLNNADLSKKYVVRLSIQAYFAASVTVDMKLEIFGVTIDFTITGESGAYNHFAFNIDPVTSDTSFRVYQVENNDALWKIRGLLALAKTPPYLGVWEAKSELIGFKTYIVKDGETINAFGAAPIDKGITAEKIVLRPTDVWEHWGWATDFTVQLNTRDWQLVDLGWDSGKDVKPVFYSQNSILRISDANFRNNNPTKWHGFINNFYFGSHVLYNKTPNFTAAIPASSHSIGYETLNQEITSPVVRKMDGQYDSTGEVYKARDVGIFVYDPLEFSEAPTNRKEHVFWADASTNETFKKGDRYSATFIYDRVNETELGRDVHNDIGVTGFNVITPPEKESELLIYEDATGNETNVKAVGAISSLITDNEISLSTDSAGEKGACELIADGDFIKIGSEIMCIVSRTAHAGSDLFQVFQVHRGVKGTSLVTSDGTGEGLDVYSHPIHQKARAISVVLGIHGDDSDNIYIPFLSSGFVPNERTGAGMSQGSMAAFSGTTDFKAGGTVLASNQTSYAKTFFTLCNRYMLDPPPLNIVIFSKTGTAAPTMKLTSATGTTSSLSSPWTNNGDAWLNDMTLEINENANNSAQSYKFRDILSVFNTGELTSTTVALTGTPELDVEVAPPEGMSLAWIGVHGHVTGSELITDTENRAMTTATPPDWLPWCQMSCISNPIITFASDKITLEFTELNPKLVQGITLPDAKIGAVTDGLCYNIQFAVADCNAASITGGLLFGCELNGNRGVATFAVNPADNDQWFEVTGGTATVILRLLMNDTAHKTGSLVEGSSAGLTDFQIFAIAPDRLQSEPLPTFSIDNATIIPVTPWTLDDPVTYLADNGDVTPIGDIQDATYPIYAGRQTFTAYGTVTPTLNKRITGLKIYWNPEGEVDWYFVQYLDINKGML